MIADVHSHQPGEGRILSVDLGKGPEALAAVAPGQLFSAGYHPWTLPPGIAPEAARGPLLEALRRPGAVAVGECGLDRRNCPLPLDAQERWLAMQAGVAEQLGLPLVLHLVGGADRLLPLKARLRTSVPWIVHGFRGKPQEAAQLVRAGLYISLGERFNPLATGAIPDDRLLLETDDSTLSPDDIAALHTPARAAAALANAARLFGNGAVVQPIEKKD